MTERADHRFCQNGTRGCVIVGLHECGRPPIQCSGDAGVKSAMPLSDSVVSAPLTDEELEEMTGTAETLQWGRDLIAGEWIKRLVAEVRRLRGVRDAIADGRPMEITAEVVSLAMAVDPEGFIGVRVRDLAALWRLHSDGWLIKGAGEIARNVWAGDPHRAPDEALDIEAILFKHRDGKA